MAGQITNMNKLQIEEGKMTEVMEWQDPDIQIIYTVEKEEEDLTVLYDIQFSCGKGGDRNNIPNMNKLQIQEGNKTEVTEWQDPDIQIIYTVEKEEADFSVLYDVQFSGGKGGDRNNPISVEKHSSNKQGAINLSDDEKSLEEVEVFRTYRPLRPKKEKKPFSQPSIRETGQSSSSRKRLESIFCKICMEPKHPNETFSIKECAHVFCSDCIAQHVAAKIQENSATVQCPEPGCKGVLEPIFCQGILPPDVFDRWGNVLCESLILGSMKFYCPFKDCSGLLVDETGENGSIILESECPHCRRLFCARCKVPWHSGIKCEDFQKLKVGERDAEDIMLMNLAKEKKWQRCPKCGFYVEKTEGCLFMKCRCNHCFCYHCGGPVDAKTHYCPKCRR